MRVRIFDERMPVSRAILAIQAIATDDELKELQRTLIAQPDKGDLIQGTGGAWR